MFWSKFLRRAKSAFKRFRGASDRTRTTDYALQSNATAIDNLTRAIKKKSSPRQRRASTIEHCLKASFGLQQDAEASQALKSALERLRSRSDVSGR